MTCLHWTIYLWKCLYLIGCPLLLRTNYRCVQLLNISVDDAKCVENVHKFTKYTHFLSVLVLIEQAKFQLTRMSSYAKNKLQMCSATQHQCRPLIITFTCQRIKSEIFWCKVFYWPLIITFTCERMKSDIFRCNFLYWPLIITFTCERMKSDIYRCNVLYWPPIITFTCRSMKSEIFKCNVLYWHYTWKFQTLSFGMY